MVKPTSSRRPRIALTALAVAGSLTLAGCSSSPTGEDTDPTSSSSAQGECGTVPQIGANDPDGLLDSFSESVQAGYNGYPDEIRPSAWAEWKSEKSGGYTAAIVGQAPAAPYIATFQTQLVESLDALGVEVLANLAPNDSTDVPGQIQMFNQALSLKPDVIFFNPASPESSTELVEQAHDAGVPVISMVTAIDSPYAVTLTQNNRLQAMETSAGVFDAIGGAGSVLKVNGVPGIPPQLAWEAGVQASLDLCPDISIAGEATGLYQPPAAQQAVVQFLATNPAGVDAVLQAGSMGWAIRDAFVQSGLDVPPIQDINASQGMAAYAAANPDYPYFGTATPPIPLAQAVAQVGVKILEGAGPKVNQIIWGPPLIDRSNLDAIVDPSWSESDGTDLGPDGIYLTDAEIAEFFNNPELGPQSPQ